MFSANVDDDDDDDDDDDEMMIRKFMWAFHQDENTFLIPPSN